MPVRGRGGPRLRAAAQILFALLAVLTVATPSAQATQATDPRAGESWPLDGDGPMGVASAWDRTTGGDTIVAVLDTGVDLTHPDLRENLWTNPDEVAGNGRDDDGNGVVDDAHGTDVIAGDGDPTDDNGHGTHVAGIIGARGGNGIGTAGVAWRVRIMPVKVLDAGAGGNTVSVAQGIDYAIAEGASVINLSLAGPQRSGALDEAISRARDAGVLVVAAAGNQSRDLALLPSWPAASDAENLVAVAASDAGGALARISSFGSPVDLVAPGDTIISTAMGGGYEWRTGTSMAAPMVAGAAALLRSAAPGADWRAIEAALLGSARQTQLPVRAGALDIGAALQALAPAAAPRTPAAATPGSANAATVAPDAASSVAAAAQRRAADRADARAWAAARVELRRASARARSRMRLRARAGRARAATAGARVHAA